MNKSAWFFCLHNEVIGPISAPSLSKMVSECRITGSDYVWAEGMPGWTRVSECSEFAALLPKAPTAALPTSAPKPEKAAQKAAEPTPKPAKAPEAAPKPKVAAAPASAPAPAPAPAPAAAPAPAPRAELDALVKVNGGAACKVLELSESSIVFEKVAGIEVGSDVKLKIESPSLGKPIEVTAILSREEAYQGKPALGADFTRMNPAHKRLIANYLSGKLEKAAA